MIDSRGRRFGAARGFFVVTPSARGPPTGFAPRGRGRQKAVAKQPAAPEGSGAGSKAPVKTAGFRVAKGPGRTLATGCQPSRQACSRSRSSGTIASVFSCVASRTTGGAWPAAAASNHRAAQRHHRSPGTRPGNCHCGCGVTRSLPAATVKARNASVITAQTVWTPASSGPVRQQPSRKKPVSGLREHEASGPPRTFRSAGREPPGGRAVGSKSIMARGRRGLMGADGG
jgi:hypothetical protein